jgi:outer membrane protein TolC
MKNNIILLLLVTIINIGGQTKKIGLLESLQIGLENSKEVKIAESVLRQSKAEIDEFSGNMLPKLSLTAAYTRLSEVDPFTITVPFSPLPINVQDAILNNYNLRLSFRQPIFTGFKLSSLKNSAINKFNANEKDLINEKNKTALNIITAYYNYYKTIKILTIVEENSIKLKKHLDDTKKFMENGLATKNDYLKIEVQYNNIELLKINAKNNLEIARTQFNKALGLNLNEKTEIELEEPKIEEIEIDYNNDLKYAYSERMELLSLNYRIHSADNIISSAKSNLYPSLYLNGNFYYNRPNSREMPLKDKFKETWDVSVSLNWDIWDWGITTAKIEQSEEIKNQLNEKYEQLKENIEQEVYSNYLKVISEYNKIKVSKLMLNLSEENYRISKEKYNNQLLSATDLLDAETSLLDSQISLTNSIVDYELAIAAYKKSLGKKLY